MLSLLNLVVEKEIKDSFSIQFLEDKQYKQPSNARLIYHRIILINSGNGEVNIDDRSFEISPSKLFLIAKDQIINFKVGTKFTGYELSFGDCFWERAPSSANNCKAVLFNNTSENQMIPLLETDYQELSSIFKSLADEFEKAGYINKIDAMAAYLKIIMIKIANVNHSLGNGIDNYDNQLYAQFLELIGKYYKTTREVTDYAKLLGISSRKLTDLSKRSSDRGAKELINEQIMAEEKPSLQFTTEPIKEIAFELNFATPDQFSHFFKKNAKISPSEYRALFLSI